MKCFVDTSAWVAHFDNVDIFHKQAENFLHQKAFLITSNITVHETVALLHSRINKKIALTAGKLLFNTKLTEMIIVSREEEEKAWNEYEDQGKTISFVDCMTKIVMKEYNLTTIFSFDRDFDSLGFQRVP